MGQVSPARGMLHYEDDEPPAERTAPPEPLEPWDRRLQRITRALKENPTDKRTLAAWGKLAGGSARYLGRLFLEQTGMTFRQWRARIRLIRALELLEQGLEVQDVAAALGYETSGGFIRLFRREFGTTPERARKKR